MKTFIGDKDGSIKVKRANAIVKQSSNMDDCAGSDPRHGVPAVSDDSSPLRIQRFRAKNISSDSHDAVAPPPPLLMRSESTIPSMSQPTPGALDKEREPIPNREGQGRVTEEEGEMAERVRDRDGRKDLMKSKKFEEKSNPRTRSKLNEIIEKEGWNDPSGYLLRDTLSDMDDDVENKDVVKGWNERYQIIRDAIQDLADAEDNQADGESSDFYRILRFERDLYSLSQDFLYTAKTYGRIIGM